MSGSAAGGEEPHDKVVEEVGLPLLLLKLLLLELHLLLLGFELCKLKL